jgi:heme transport system permease protein
MNTIVESACSKNLVISSIKKLSLTKLYVLGVLTFALAIVSLSVGAVPIELNHIFRMLVGADTNNYPQHYESILFHIRFPRILLAILVGGVLALSGAVMQSMFRNPLADPALIGISAGAAMTAAAMIVFIGTVSAFLPDSLKTFLLPIAAFFGSLLISLLIFRIGTVNGKTFVATMLLAGIALNAISGALTGLIVYISNDQQLRDITFWMMGSLGRSSWDIILPSLPLFIISAIPMLYIANELNIFALGESQAKHLGVKTEKIKRIILLSVSLAIGTSVALTGVIGFVGLMVPHLVRILIGPDHRYLLPGSFLLGACTLMLADNLARTVIVPQELPIGIITSCLGGPFFIYLLINKRGAVFS